MQPPSVIWPFYVLNLPAFGARNRPAGSSAYRHSHLALTNPEFMPPLGPQYYEEEAGYDAPTATVRPAGSDNSVGSIVGFRFWRIVER